MDRRHGKRALPSEASEEKEIKGYSDYQQQWTQHDEDMSAMVSALSQVIGTRENNPAVQSSGDNSSSSLSESSQLPPQDQGTASLLASSFVLTGPNFRGFCPFSRSISINPGFLFFSLPYPFVDLFDHFFSFLEKLFLFLK